MSAFSTFRLTDAGLLLAAKGQTGARIEYTRVIVGDGLLPEGQSVRSLTDVIHAVLELPITGFDLFEDGPPNFTAVIKSAFNNFQLQNGFYYRELALFATDPEAGEILYCYANAGELAEWIPPIGSPALSAPEAVRRKPITSPMLWSWNASSFPTPREGIRAQIQHLKTYACNEPLNYPCVDPRYQYVTRGCAPYVEWLGIPDNPQGKGWAGGKGYGKLILDILDGIRNTAAPDDLQAFCDKYRILYYQKDQECKNKDAVIEALQEKIDDARNVLR